MDTPRILAAAAPLPELNARPVGIGLIGAGRIGTSHAHCIAFRVPGARLLSVADPVDGAAARLASVVGAPRATEDIAELLADPEVEAVVIAAPATTHTELVAAAAEAGKAVFVEKPMALTLEDADRAIAAAAAAGVPLQVGFNRRFAADFATAQHAVATGRVGIPQLLRSLTRDPGLANPDAVKPWTIFNETLIHDFDALNWFNSGARPVEVSAFADALVAPDFRAGGLLDTAIVTIRYDNGALATAEASFSAAYGYDVRGEVFGSAGMATAGDVRSRGVQLYDADGAFVPTVRQDTDLFLDAYTGEFAAFAAAARSGHVEGAGGQDARRALSLALAARASVERGTSVCLREDGSVA